MSNDKVLEQSCDIIVLVDLCETVVVYNSTSITFTLYICI